MSVNLNVEQMVSMVFEMRGTLAHEVEARRATESALMEARAHIEQLRDVSQRDNNKWSNLLGRVKELEVAGRLDNRLGELNHRADKYSRNNDQQKLMQVFQEIKSRLDAQERDYREGLAKASRDSQRDYARMEHDLRAMLDQQLLRGDGQRQQDADYISRLQARVVDLEKEFSVFMNAQVQMQQSINNKEKDGDWLKIYLTEQFNAQRHSTEAKLTEVHHQLQRVQDTTRVDVEKASSELDRRLSDLSESLESERASRDAADRKIQKALKTTVGTMGENLSKAVSVLDAKMVSIKSTQNEAIANLHAMVRAESQKFEAHAATFQDFAGVQADQTAKEHALAQRIDGLEEVLKAEIKARIKNHQKAKLTALTSQKKQEAKVEELKSYLLNESESQRHQAALARADEEEQARLLHIAMETRSVLDSVVCQVEDQHSAHLRQQEWQAFGAVIEREMKSREANLQHALSTQGGDGLISSKVEEVKSFVTAAFRDFELHERRVKQEEEEQAMFMHIAMESRAVLDSMVTHIADRADADMLRSVSSGLRVIDDRLRQHEDRLITLKELVDSEHDATSVQLLQTHDEVMHLAQDLATRVDAHTHDIESIMATTSDHHRDIGELDGMVAKVRTDAAAARSMAIDMQETIDVSRKESASIKSRMQDLVDVQDSHTRDVKLLKSHRTDTTEQLASHHATVKQLQSLVADASIMSQQHRADVDHKLQLLRASESQSAASAFAHSAKSDEIIAVLKRLDACDRTTADLAQTTDVLSSKQSRTDQSVTHLQSLLNDSTVATDRKVKDLRDKIDSQLEESEQSLKKLDKRLTTQMEEFDRLSGDLASRAGGLTHSSKAAEDGLGELRARVAALAGVQDRVDAIRTDLKDLQSEVDTRLPSEKHARDVKDLQTALQELRDATSKDSRSLRDTVSDTDDRLTKVCKDALSRIQSVEERVQSVGRDDDSAPSKRVVDAAIVEKEVRSVETSVDALSKKLKDASNLQEDALNRVSQDVKRLTLRVDELSQGDSSSRAADPDVAKKAVHELAFRVDALESDLKVKTVGGINNQIADLTSKFDTRARDVDAKFASVDTRLTQTDSEVRRLGAATDEAEAKTHKRLKELQQAMDESSQRDAEMQNSLKADASKQQVETDQLIKSSESRTAMIVKAIQKQVDDQEVDLKSRWRSVDEKLHEMEWTMKYAQDNTFAKDAQQIRNAATRTDSARPQHTASAEE